MREFAARAKEDAKLAPDIYAKVRARQETMKKLTMERFKMLESGRKQAAAAEPPSPSMGGQ